MVIRPWRHTPRGLESGTAQSENADQKLVLESRPMALLAERLSDKRARPDRIRVLHVAAGKLYGGVETLLVTLARYHKLCPEMEPEFAVCFEGRLAEELRATG